MNRKRFKGRKALVRILGILVAFATVYALILPAITLDSDTATEEPGVVVESPAYEAPAEQPVGTETAAAEEPEPVMTEVFAAEAAAAQEPAPAEEPAVNEPAPSAASPADIETNVPAEENPVPAAETAPTEAAPADTPAAAPEETAVPAEPENAEDTEELVILDADEVEIEAETFDEEDAEASAEPEVEEEPKGDPTADVESYGTWEAMFANLTLTGDWAEDLLKVAKTQLGYTESTANFIINEAGDQKGYTRYGAWYGCPYGDWCAMFVSFCLNYAEIPAEYMPREAACTRWMNALTQREMLVKTEDFGTNGVYVPQPGDLVFFRFRQQTGSDHVGLVYKVEYDENGQPAYIVTIEGNAGNCVQMLRYNFWSDKIVAYAMLPENPEKAEEEAAEPEMSQEPQSFTAETDDVKVSVEAPAGAFPAGTSMTVIPVYDSEVLVAAMMAVGDEVKSVTAVDITFCDADGNKIEPALPIRVTITSDTIAETDTTLVHVNDAMESEVVAPAEDAEPADNEVVFDSDAFSVYALVGTETMTVDYLTADGSTVKVTVTFDENAEIPANAELEVTETAKGEDGWMERSLRLEEVLKETYGYVVISDVRFLNVRILVDGEEFEPKAPVEIRVEYAEEFDTDYTYDYADEELDPSEIVLGEKHFATVHYTEDAAEILESEITVGEGCITESVAQTDSFSDYDLVYFTEDVVLDEPTAPYGLSLEVSPNMTNGIPLTLDRASEVTGPSHEKSLDNKGDGTYDIHLNVKGEAHTVSQASNVNVVIVYDTSTSMSNAHSYGPYYVYTQNASGRYGTDGSGNYTNLYYRNGGRYVQLNNDAYTGTVYSNQYGTEYSGNRYVRTTRADVAEPVVRSFVNSLYSYQNAADPTNIQTTFITFNGSPYTRASWTTSASDITSYLVGNGTNNSYNHNSYSGTSFYASGTNWERALRTVETALNNKPDNDPTYVVFITDGAPTTSATITTVGTQYEECYIDARDEALRIQQAVNATGGDFYSIYAYGDETDWLATMMYYANNNGTEPATGRGTTFSTKGYYNAADTSALSSAIGEIFDAIVKTLGISNTSITDGTTSDVELSTGGSETADLLDVNEDSFRYSLSWNVTANEDGTYGFTMPDKITGSDVNYTVTVSGENITIAWPGGSASYTGKVEFNVLTVDWTSATDFYKFAPPAAVFDDPDVKWNLKNLGTLLSGVTYDVVFECYPSQYTMDLIADLKNGYVSYESLDQNIRKYLLKRGDDYVLATNTAASLTYTDTRTTDGEQSTDYTNPDPQSTYATKVISVAKVWENTLDDQNKPTSLKIYVTRDGANRYELTLDDAGGWKEDAYISYGIMTIHDGVISVKAPGHDYSFSEPAAAGYHWELDTPVLHPMLINGTETMLVKVDAADAPAMSGANATAAGEDGYTYYKLTVNGTAGYYKADTAVASLTANNYRRSYLDVLKNVTGDNKPEGDDRDAFPFTVTVTNANAANGQENDTNSDYWVWFSIKDMTAGEDGEIVTDPSVASAAGIRYQLEDNSITTSLPAENFNGYYCVPSGTAITVQMKDGYNLHILNLPTGSTYTVTESEIGSDSSYSFVSIAGQRAYKQTAAESEQIESAGTVSGQSVSGTIEETNSAYTVTAVNRYATVDVQLKKTDADGNVLSGAVFDLAKYGTSWETIREDIKPGDEETSTENPVDLGGLGIGRYSLTESVAPDGYVILENTVYFEVYKDTDGALKVRLTDENGGTETLPENAEIEGPGQGETPVYTVKIQNTPGAELPLTGGSGTRGMLLAGLALLMSSSVLLAVTLKRRRLLLEGGGTRK